MLNPGHKNLGQVATADINAATAGAVITESTAEAGEVIAYLGSLEGMLAATIGATFNYGAGGTSAVVHIETSANQGQSWIEVARFDFATASAEKAANLSGLTPVGVYDATTALSANAVKDGLLGDRWRARLVTVGTYSGSTSLSVWMNAR